MQHRCLMEYGNRCLPYAVHGNDTIIHKDIEYKAFYAGNFAYGNIIQIHCNKKYWRSVTAHFQLTAVIILHTEMITVSNSLSPN